ncbi:hypothetical protein HDU67_001924 [Dinochytrium kinnereticum]|nr:hypothetical protein HDU67_001924 [Dinochytrium kinnereticum]
MSNSSDKKEKASTYNFRQSLQYQGEVPNFLKVLQQQSGQSPEDKDPENRRNQSEDSEDDEKPMVVVEEGIRPEDVQEYLKSNPETSKLEEKSLKTTKLLNSKIQKRKSGGLKPGEKPKVSKKDKNKSLLSFGDE